MITNIHEFLLKENIQQSKTILKKLGKDPNKELAFQQIKDALKNTPNLIGYFVKQFYEKNQRMDHILDVIEWISNNRNMISKLPKNILQYDTIESLEDDIQSLKRENLINKFYKSLYKSMIKAVDDLDEEKKKKFNDLALSFVELNEEKRKNFTPLKYFEANNISIEEFMEALHNFIESENVSDIKKEVLEKLKKYEGKYKIVYNKDNVLVIQSNDRDVVCDLGSQNWCIVYNPDSYAESYFGPKTDNTQFIVYNFNLPSSSANSMFGVTIDAEGKAKSGGSQNKRNQGVSLDEIYEMTGIPYETLSPTEDIKKKMIDRKKIKDFFSSEKTPKEIEKFREENDFNKELFDSYLNDYHKNLVRNYFGAASGEIRTLQDISNFYKKHKFDQQLFFDEMDSTLYLGTRSEQTFNETFKDKSLEEVIDMFNDAFLTKILFRFKDDKLITYTLSLKNEDILYYVLLELFNHLYNRWGIESIEYNVNVYITNKVTNLVDSIKYNSYEELLQRLTFKKDKLNNLFNKIKHKYVEISELMPQLKKFFDESKSKIKNHLMSYEDNDIKFESFKEYKSLYDKYILPTENVPYESIFGFYDNVDILTMKFYEDESFNEFLSKILKENEDNIDKSDVIEKIIVNDKTDEYYLLEKDDYSNLIIDVVNKTDTDLTPVVKTDHITGLFLYKNMNKYDKVFKDEIGIKTTDNGIDYVEVSDFTSFDDLIFEEEYFNSMEDLFYFEWYEVDDDILEQYYEDLDDYNIIDIADTMMKEVPELNNYYSINTVRENLVDSENMKVNDKPVKVPISTLKNQFGSTENLKKLKEDLQKLIFNIEDLDIEDADIHEDTIDNEIKREMLYRALMYAQEGAQYDYVWNALIDVVGEYLGSNNWPTDEESIPSVNGKSIYKFENNKLLFTIDLDWLTQSIKNNYNDINYNYGNDFKWDNLLSYVARELTSPTDMSYTFEKSSWETPNKTTYNEAFRNL
jgi:hypothetical protein